MYRADVMTMTKEDEEKINILDRKILRIILEPVKIVVNKLKQQRIKCLDMYVEQKERPR